jgi:hypothetical protein
MIRKLFKVLYYILFRGNLEGDRIVYKRLAVNIENFEVGRNYIKLKNEQFGSEELDLNR